MRQTPCQRINFCLSGFRPPRPNALSMITVFSFDPLDEPKKEIHDPGWPPALLPDPRKTGIEFLKTLQILPGSPRVVIEGGIEFATAGTAHRPADFRGLSKRAKGHFKRRDHASRTPGPAVSSPSMKVTPAASRAAQMAVMELARGLRAPRSNSATVDRTMPAALAISSCDRFNR